MALAILVIILFLYGIYLLPEIPVDADGDEILDGSTPIERCNKHQWDVENNKIKCKICNYTPRNS